MELKLIRNDFSDNSTEGILYINNEQFCVTLEDKDRSLYQSQRIEDITKIKVFAQTCIPYGKYNVILDYSEHFKRILPHILDVKGFGGVRIHSGNKPADTEGCVLVGTVKSKDVILNSHLAFDPLFEKMANAIKLGEKITLEITR